MQLRSFLRKSQFPIIRTDFHFLAGFEFAFEQLRRERVEQMFLDGALQRTRQTADRSLPSPAKRGSVPPVQNRLLCNHDVDRTDQT